MTNLFPVLTVAQDALLASNAAANAVWERDGKVDKGTCGGAMCQLDARSVFAKAAIMAGIARVSGKEVWLSLPVPTGIRSQNMDIPEAMQEAALEVIRKAGFGSAIKKAWTYVD